MIVSDYKFKAERLLVCAFTQPSKSCLKSYRQAIDVAGLKATSLQNILTIVMVLGFLAHGYVTDEFEATEERLGVYLPVRHFFRTPDHHF